MMRRDSTHHIVDITTAMAESHLRAQRSTFLRGVQQHTPVRRHRQAGDTYSGHEGWAVVAQSEEA